MPTASEIPNAAQPPETFRRHSPPPLQSRPLNIPAPVELTLDNELRVAVVSDTGRAKRLFAEAYDASATLLKVLDLLARSGRRLSSVVNGVSKLHGQVSSMMWRHLWSGSYRSTSIAVLSRRISVAISVSMRLSHTLKDT